MMQDWKMLLEVCSPTTTSPELLTYSQPVSFVVEEENICSVGLNHAVQQIK